MTRVAAGCDAPPSKPPDLHYRFIHRPSCPMCGGTACKIIGIRLNRSQGRRPRHVTGIGVTVKKCKRCELIFADPMPAPLDFEDHYGVPPESYWKPSYFAVAEDYFAAEIAVAKRLLEGAENPKALDIGVGIGKSMVALQRAGFDTFGIEPSEPFRDRASSTMRIDPDRLQLAAVENAVFDPETFDFITFGAVLEHIQEPGDALVRSVGWLKPGGIVHAEIPSSRYMISKLTNAFYSLSGLNYVTNISPMHAPYHLYEFGLNSFHEHGRAHGYYVKHHSYSVATIYHVPTLFKGIAGQIMEHTKTGMQLTVWLSKNSAA